MTKLREYSLVALGMLAMAIATTWPLARDARGALPSDLGDPLFGTFVLAWDADRLAHGLAGVWDAPFYFPWHDTLALAEHLFGIAIFTAPLQWVTRSPVVVYNIAFLLSYVLAGVGMYGLALSLWKRRDAAAIAALAFACAPHRAMHLGHIQVLMSGWMPVGLWGLHRYFASGSRRALAAFTAAFILLGMSNGYFLYFFALPVIVLVVAELWRRGNAEGVTWLDALRRPVMQLAIAAGVIGTAFLPIAAAYLRVRDALGLHRSLGELRGYSASLADYLKIPPTLSLWVGRLEPGAPERCLFPGAFTVGLAVVSLAAMIPVLNRVNTPGAPDERRQIRLYGIVCVLAAWLSLGPFARGPYRFLMELVPGFDGLRVPARFSVIVSLALAVLAAGGAAWLLRRLSQPAALIVAIVLSVALVLEGSGAPVQMERFDASQPGRRQVNAWLKMSPPGGVLELPISTESPADFTVGYQFNALIHQHPIVNGYSGYDSVLQRLLGEASSPLRGGADELAATVAGLRRIGVRYIVLHDVLYARYSRPWSPDPGVLAAAFSRMPDQVISQRHENNIWSWQLADAPPLAVTGRSELAPIPVGEFVAFASAASEDLRFAFDGRLATWWSTPGAQTGSEWIRVEFKRERDIRCLELAMGRDRVGDYPRALIVAEDDGSGGQRIVFDGPVIAQLIEGIGRDSRDSRIRINLPAGRTRVLWLRQARAVPGVPWSVSEVALREPKSPL